MKGGKKTGLMAKAGTQSVLASLISIIIGLAAGALWGMIPGLLKAFFNINEVIACIMTNWIAANVVTWLFDMSSLKNVVENTKSSYIYSTSLSRYSILSISTRCCIPTVMLSTLASRSTFSPYCSDSAFTLRRASFF